MHVLLKIKPLCLRASLLLLLIFPACPLMKDKESNKPTPNSIAVNIPNTPGGKEGNGTGYGGGDGPLASIRGILIRALYLINNQSDVDDFGKFDTCAKLNEPFLCNQVSSLTTDQKVYLKNFAMDVSRNMLSLNLGGAPVPFKFSSAPLTVTLPNGSSRVVSGRTPIGPSGEIELYDGIMNSMSDYGKLALIAHEFGHKVGFGISGTYINDTDSMGPFSGPDGGKQLLDSFGAAIALYVADHLTKTAVMFPNPSSTCVPAALDSLMKQSAYFVPPDLDSSPSIPSNIEEITGQKSIPLKNALNAIQKNDFTIFALAKADTDIASRLGNFRGNVILSNQDSGLPYSGWVRGIQILRLKNGNLGVYVGSGKPLNTGLPFSTGKFHFIALKRNAGNLYVYLDGSGVTLPDKYYDYLYDSDGDGYYAIDGAGYGVNTDNSAHSDAVASLGKQALNSYFCNSRANSGNEYACTYYWKGHIASFSFYPSALSDSKILSEYLCAATAESAARLNLAAGPDNTIRPAPTPDPLYASHSCPADDTTMPAGTAHVPDSTDQASIDSYNVDFQAEIAAMNTACGTTIPVTQDMTGYLIHFDRRGSYGAGVPLSACQGYVSGIRKYCDDGWGRPSEPNKAWVKRNITRIHCSYKEGLFAGDDTAAKTLRFEQAVRLCSGKLNLFDDWGSFNVDYLFTDLIKKKGWRVTVTPSDPNI